MPEEEVTQPTIKELTPPRTNLSATKLPNQKPTMKPNISPPIKPTTQKPIPKNIPTPKLETQKEIEYVSKPIKKLKPEYKYIGKETLSQMMGRCIPKQLIPTARVPKIVNIIFLLIVILALVQFPFDKLLSGNTNITIEIGYPHPFLELDVLDPEKNPLRPLNLFLGVISYFIIAYIIDVTINIIASLRLMKSKAELRKMTKIYKNIKPTLADRTTQKIFKK